MLQILKLNLKLITLGLYVVEIGKKTNLLPRRKSCHNCIRIFDKTFGI